MKNFLIVGKNKEVFLSEQMDPNAAISEAKALTYLAYPVKSYEIPLGVTLDSLRKMSELLKHKNLDLWFKVSSQWDTDQDEEISAILFHPDFKNTYCFAVPTDTMVQHNSHKYYVYENATDLADYLFDMVEEDPDHGF